MVNKKLVMFGAVLGMTVGGAVPTLFGANPFGGWSIVGSMIGGFVGIWAAVKLGRQFG